MGKQLPSACLTHTPVIWISQQVDATPDIAALHRNVYLYAIVIACAQQRHYGHRNTCGLSARQPFADAAHGGGARSGGPRPRGAAHHIHDRPARRSDPTLRARGDSEGEVFEAMSPDLLANGTPQPV